MSTRTALTVIGGVVGAYFGYPQLGLVIGGLIGGAVDPQQIQGPKIGEVNVQTSQEGAPRTIVYGTIACYGNIIQTGQVIKVETSESQGKGGGPEVTSERAYRTFAVRVCEGPIAAYLRVWEDNKLVYDMRPESGMIAESEKWAENKVFYYGDESQLPDPTLVANLNADTPSYRGSAYFVAISEDVTDRRGSVAQYRFEVATTVAVPEVTPTITHSHSIPNTFPGPGIFRRSDGELGIAYSDGVGAPHNNVNGGYYSVKGYLYDFTEISNSTVVTQPSPGQSSIWNGDGISVSSWDMSGGMDGFAIMRNGSSFGGCYLVINGEQVASLKPDSSYPDNWWSSNSPANPDNDGRRIWFGNGSVYVGTTSRGVSGNVNNLCLWSLSVGFPVYASAIISNICATPGDQFYTHLGNDGRMRILADGELRVYEAALDHVSTTTLPFTTTNIHGFGVDGDIAVFVFSSPAKVEIRNTNDWSLTNTITDNVFVEATNTRVVFTNDSLFIQTYPNPGIGDTRTHIYRIPYETGSYAGLPVVLGDIVADVHDRCGFETTGYDVSELDDLVAGFSLAGDYTGASAIDALRPVYFFDKSEHDKKLWYPKRGAAVIETLTIDDLTEVPDTTNREQAIEVPKKLHLRYQHAASGYAPVKATASASSPDMLTTGEAAIEVPVVLNEDQAAQTVDKMYKVTKSEIRGTTEVSVPLNIGAKYVAGNCLGLALRGRVSRERIEQQEFMDGKIKLTLKPDRQSAYTSDLTGVPIPPPTLPPSTIVGETEMAILDISARVDSEDDLNYLVAVSGELPPWYGARYQRSLDGGETYTSVLDITQASIMGELQNTVADASQYFTDHTNTVTVQLYRDNQSLESISDSEFLSEGGAFALEKADGSWEIMQYLNAVENSSGAYTLSTLHRGLLNSGTDAHSLGAKFVMLQRPSHIPAQSSWIGQPLTHRAISFGDTADNTFNEETEVFVGRSQIEWPVAYLELTRSGSNISATWTPRHRFGTDDNPIASVNFQGYRVTIDGGSNGSVTFDTTTAGFTNYDASSLGGGLTVTVSSLNRITGAGPSTSDVI